MTISDKYWHSVKLFYCKTYARGVFRTQSNIILKLSCNFCKKSSTIDVRMGSKYTSAYVYIQVSPIEIIWILNIYAVEYIFLTKEEWNKVAVSELKEISVYISYHLVRVPVVWFIPSDTLMVKPNAKYSTHFIPPGATKVFKRNRNSRYEIIRNIVSLKLQANNLMNLWWSLF